MVLDFVGSLSGYAGGGKRFDEAWGRVKTKKKDVKFELNSKYRGIIDVITSGSGFAQKLLSYRSRSADA